MSDQPTVSVVIPVFNSQDILPTLVTRLEEILKKTTSAFEIILVDDASLDQSWNVITNLAEGYSSIVGIQFMRNYGQHNALLCGIRQAQYKLIVTMDDDLQNPPEEIPNLMNKLDEGYDVVYGTPQRERHGMWRDMASIITKLVLQSIMSDNNVRNMSAFKIFRAEIRNAFNHYQGPYLSIDVLLSWGTTKFTAIPVRHSTRYSGESNYTFRKLMVHTFNMLTGFSTLPLRIARSIGFFFTLFGILVLVYVIGRYVIQGGSVPGFPFLASIIAIFSGAQLFVIGIIGEYLARMYEKIVDRPTYIIRSTISISP